MHSVKQCTSCDFARSARNAYCGRMGEDTGCPLGRRERTKARHRRRIVEAAAALIDERDGTGFTADELAEQADVARRTVFNHFGSVEEIVLEALGGMLASIVAGIEDELSARAADPGDADGMFDQLAAAVRAADLVTPICRLKRILGPDGGGVSHGHAQMFERAFTELRAQLAATLRRLHPDTDPFLVDLMCGAVVSGGVITVGYWEDATGGVDTPESRRVWDGLLDRMIAAARTGYGATAPGPGSA